MSFLGMLLQVLVLITLSNFLQVNIDVTVSDIAASECL